MSRASIGVMDPLVQEFHDEGHGYDVFGLHPASVRRAATIARPICDRYFRVGSHGAQLIPRDGPAILVANHGGVLPVDAAVLWLDVLRKTGRVLRVIADRFVPLLPFVSTMFARVGVVSGTRGNVRRLLERGELIAIFPEGVTGPAKRFRDRYQLQEWRVGHAELAIRHRAPVVPVAIVGAEESWTVAWKLRGLHAFGAPYLPVPASLVPLPARYHLRYGAPIALHDGVPPDQADDPDAAAAAAARTRAGVEEQLGHALAARGGVFW
jgi:1-acyl-sn-glycerol-3-phosphate acyltransferase